ncbi:unnamed protein product, partial [Didymodactylos carnosus]
VQIPKSKFISDLKWMISTTDKEEILSPTDVEIKVHSVGLNFRDILKGRGLFPHMEEFGIEYHQQHANARNEIVGSEFSGTIIRKGLQVKALNVNDTVIGATIHHGAFKSHVIVDQCLVVPIKKLISETTMKKLQYQLHIQHGVDIATVQYCQKIGAEIIVTAGTEEKREYLREQYGLKHIFSRDLSFVYNIRQLFPDGVNVILNSLS